MDDQQPDPQQPQAHPLAAKQENLLKNYENYFNSVIERISPPDPEPVQPVKKKLSTTEQTQELANNIERLAQLVTTLLTDHGPELVQAVGKNIKE